MAEIPQLISLKKGMEEQLRQLENRAKSKQDEALNHSIDARTKFYEAGRLEIYATEAYDRYDEREYEELMTSRDTLMEQYEDDVVKCKNAMNAYHNDLKKINELKMELLQMEINIGNAYLSFPLTF